MAEVALLLASFNIVAGIVSKIWELGETYYKKSQEWEDFKVKVKSLERNIAVWLGEFKDCSISNKVLIDSLKESTARIDSLSEALKKEEERLQQEKRRDEAREQNSIWIIRLTRRVIRCCSRAPMIVLELVFPTDVGWRTQLAEVAFENFRNLFKLKEEARNAAQNEISRTPYLLPFHHDIRYVPLEDTESKIHEELKKNSTGARPIVVLLYGGPGKGKSSLVRHVALHYSDLEKEEPSFDQVIFLECGPEVKTSAAQLELLQHLAVDITQDKQPSTSDLRISEQVKRAIKSRKLLIIFDDVWEVEFLECMIDIMCRSEVKCLVTSQKGDLCSGLDCSSISKIQIQSISQEVARKILASYVGFPNQDIPNQEILVEIDKMIESTDGNPLALASIVSSVSEDHREDLGEWKEANGMVTQALNAEPTHFMFSTKYPRTFWSVMQVSIRSLREESKNVLLLMHLCTGPSVPEEVIRFLHQISKSEKQSVTFQNLASELVARELVKINTNSSNIYPHEKSSEKSWSTHSLHKLFMEEDKGMQEQKREMFQSLKLGFSSALDNKPPFPSKIVPEASEDADALLKAVFCALYFEGQFSKDAAAQLNIQDHDTFNDLRRKAFEPITRLLGQSMTEQWDPSTQAAAKQVFVQYFYKCEFDAENMSVLLKSAYPSAQLASIQAICDICLADERPFLKEGNQLLPILVSFLADSRTPILQYKAAACLTRLTFVGGSHQLQILNQKGALETLVKALSNDRNPSAQEKALSVLGNLAHGPECCALQILNDRRILPLLVKMLANTQNPEIQTRAAFALSNLAAGPESCQQKIAQEDGLLAALVKSLSVDETPELQSWAASALLNLATGDPPIKHQILQEHGLVAALVKCLSKQKNPKLQRDAAWALSNLATGPESCKRKIAEEDGLLAALVKSLSVDETPELQSWAASALVNLATGDPPIKHQILQEHGLVAALVKCLSKQKNPKLQGDAAWALSNLATGPESCKRKIAEEDGLLAALVKSLSVDETPELQSWAASALVNLATGDPPIKHQILQEHGLVAALVKCLSKEKNPKLQEYAAWALNNLAAGPESCKQKIAEEDGVPAALVKLLSLDQTPELQFNAASALMNLAAGDPPIKLQILQEHGLVAALVKCLSKEKNRKLQEYAAWALSNLAAGPELCKRKIAEEDGLLAALVKSPSLEKTPELQSWTESALVNLAAGEP